MNQITVGCRSLFLLLNLQIKLRMLFFVGPNRRFINVHDGLLYIPRPEIPGNFFSSSFEQGVLDMVGLLLKLLVKMPKCQNAKIWSIV